MSREVEKVRERVAEAWKDWRDDPRMHDWMEPCGQMEGTDHCWLCGRPRMEHRD